MPQCSICGSHLNPTKSVNFDYGELLVKITVYADESGTHDLSAKQQGSEIAIIAGYAGYCADWATFCAEWQAVLGVYGVSCFHFSEYADKKRRSKDKHSPYFGWDDKRLHDFLFELAAIAGNRVRFPFSPSFILARFNNDPAVKRALKSLGLSETQINGPHLVYVTCFHEFYELFLEDLRIRWPDFNDSISFILDQKDDTVWKMAANQMFDLFKERDSRLVGISFDDKKTCLPLQAADMIAYRMRQLRANQLKTGKPLTLGPLDFALWGNFKPDELREYAQNLVIADARRSTKI